MVAPDKLTGSAYGILIAGLNLAYFFGPLVSGFIIDSKKDIKTGNKLQGFNCVRDFLSK